MTLLFNNIIRILLSTSLYCLNYSTISCYKKTNFRSDQDANQPVFAHVIFRHGERNINKSFPNDPYKNESFWPGGYGALTNVGKKEVYELGKYLRRRYANLIGEHYSSKEIYIQSTDYDRTLMSAEVLAAGIYPASAEHIWNENLIWQPIPVHTVPITQEKLLAWNIPCARFEYLFKEYTNSEEYNSMYANYNSSIKEWEEHSGKSLKQLVDIMYLYDTLYVENRKLLELPKWAIEAVQKKSMEYLAAFHLQAFTSSTELKKLEAGFVIKEMLDRFKNKSLSLLDPNRSLWVYAAHDLSIVNILNAFDLYELHIPPYASSLHFELYVNGTNFYGQLFYRRDNEEVVLPLQIPNCGIKCPLEEFYKLYEDILPKEFEDYNSLCQPKIITLRA